MDRRSPVMVSPNQSSDPLGTPITSLPAFTPVFSRRASWDQRRASSSSSRTPLDTPATGAAAADGRGGHAAATPSFANRGFVSRLDSPDVVQSSSQSAAAVTSSSASGGALLRPAAPTLWERHGRRLSAPSGYTETAASEGPSPSFQIQAPSGLTDSEDESEDEDGQHQERGHGGRRSSGLERRRHSLGGSLGAAGVRPLSPAELALSELTARLERQLKVQGQAKVARLERLLLELDANEIAAQQAAQLERQRQQEEAARADEAERAQQAQQRQRILAALRAEHERKAREAQQQLARKEEAAKAEQQRREQAAQQAKQAAEQAQRAQQAAAAAAQADAARKAQEGAAAAAAETKAKQQAEAAAAAKQAQAAAAASAPKEPFPVRIAPSAAQWEQQCAEQLKAAQDMVRPFVEDRAMRDKKRSIDKFVTLNVQQISATLNQVRAKGMALVHFVGQQQGAQRVYALLTLANKLLSQCEAQVTRLHSFAFPVAEVAVAVAAAHPDFVPLLVGRLHQVCVLCVPKYYSYKSGGDEDAYLQKMGYKFTTDDDTGKVTKESTDDYVGRMQGYVLLLAAITQSDNPANPYGLAQAWTFLARLLNGVPANRITATALDAFLKVAGYRLRATYRSQFFKLLQYIDSEFLADLSKQSDPDARAVYTRIQTYLKTGRFNQAPEGRDMPQSDASSYDRA